MEEKEQKFFDRICSAITTVEAWDADPLLLAECRLMIPFDSLMEGNESVLSQKESLYVREDDFLYSGNALFLKRLALFFQKDVMTWVNNPPCSNCGSKDTECQGIRGPESPAEREGQAGRVEVYSCKACSATTTFPRYNSVRKLLEVRKGRCGEYANLFGLYCRSVGFETRYVSDWTDHVWVEVLVGDEWIMADSCEGTINKPAMYESGWGKKLNYIVGTTCDAVVDVTSRYTRKFQENDFQERRRKITSTEDAGEIAIQRGNQRLRQGLSKARVEELNYRLKRETLILKKKKALSEWTESEKHGRGRISGSLEWKVSREEDGTSQDEETSPPIVRALQVEQFHPAGSVEISIFPKDQRGIIVTGANCDVGQPGCISMVVIDDIHLGCVLLCRSFTSWEDLSKVVTTIPSNRIVVLKGKTKGEEATQSIKKRMSLLGGFELPKNLGDGVMFMGQIEAHPHWATCTTYQNCQYSGFSILFPQKRRTLQKLRTEHETVPQNVATRLPESAMPFQTQLLASEAVKRSAFLTYANNKPSVIGYTTKDSSPVYLLDSTSFPFHEANATDWNTFHFLPEALVPKDDNGVVDDTVNCKFDIPLEEDFFTSLFGKDLIVNSTGAETVLKPVNKALQNSKLVGLYFSGHWCGPCRRFTPLLAEAYSHLRETFPVHGLEIVFVSSDRSSAEFKEYYKTMPWKAVAYDELRLRQQEISKRYSVRGIPALIILDPISGQIVSSNEQSRNDLMRSCQRGDSGIEEMFKSWLKALPEATNELYNILELSCIVDKEEDNKSMSPEGPSNIDYLVRSEEPKFLQDRAQVDAAVKVKELFTKLVEAGEDRNTAAAKAIKLVGNPQQQHQSSYDPGKLTDGTLKKLEESDCVVESKTSIAVVQGLNTSSKGVVETILKTILKYLENTIREPWNPRFRSIKMSNKVVDRATHFEGSVEFIRSFGMDTISTSQDFMITIPVAANLELMKKSLIKASKEVETVTQE